MAVDENNVRNIIIQLEAKQVSGTVCEQLMAAWQEAYDLRNHASSSYDPTELAVAEHYLFARSRVCTGEVSVMQMRAMVRGYDAAKQVGLGPLLQSNSDKPTSAPTEAHVRWGLLGADAGEVDRKLYNPKASPPLVTVPKFFKVKAKQAGY